MMLQLLGKIPRIITIATSGGSDSMAILDFLRKSHTVRSVFVDHGTSTSRDARVFVSQYCETHNIPLDVHAIQSSKPRDQSWEEYWRNERLGFFWQYECPVVTGHNLDDNVETWLWSSCHGNPKTIPYRNRNIIRPFMLNKKSTLKKWCEDKLVPWIEDESNSDQSYTRNFIRHTMVENALRVNPGIYKVIAKKIRIGYEEV